MSGTAGRNTRNSHQLLLRTLSPPGALSLLPTCPGRALHVRSDGTFYIGRGYAVYASQDGGRSWTKASTIPIPLKQTPGQLSRLAARLLRFEVKALTRLSDGALAACNRQWVYHARPGDALMSPSTIEQRAQPLKPPMTIAKGPDDRLLFGEYNSKIGHNLPVRLYVSDDRGRSFDVARVFEAGSILHVHSLLYDEHLHHYWLFTGDYGHEPGIGRLSADLRDFEWVHKGQQRFRAVEAFDFGDRLIYGTDTHLEPNAVMSMDKATGRIERLRELDGSCIYACRFGGLYALSTTVEPSPVNHARHAGLWLSRDGETWTRVFQAEKDRWHPIYFQFGSLVLPRGASEREVILFSGQAVKRLDGRVVVAAPPEG